MVVPSAKREQVLKLIEEKEKIERKINQLGEILKVVSSNVYSLNSNVVEIYF